MVNFKICQISLLPTDSVILDHTVCGAPKEIFTSIICLHFDERDVINCDVIIDILRKFIGWQSLMWNYLVMQNISLN
jgi:hypothetical protein